MVEALSIYDGVVESLKSSPGTVAQKAYDKLVKVINKNSGFAFLQSIAKVLAGEDAQIPEQIILSDVPNYKFAPLTSCDVERSFSIYKTILSDRRQRLTEDNLEKLIVCYINQN